METVAHLIRSTRSVAGLSQTALARRARTTPRHVRRIEQGEVSPTVEMVERLLAAMGRQLKLSADVGPLDNRSDRQLREDARLSAPERLSQTASLSRLVTSLAAAASRERP